MVNDGYPLVNVHITNWETSPFVHAKIHYFNGDFPVRYVKLPEGNDG